MPRKEPSQAPRRRPEDGGAVLLAGAGVIGPAGPSGEQAGAALEVDGDLVVLLDARALVDVARRAVLTTTREHILAGKRPDGGPQRPLSTGRLTDANRVSEHRGVRTGDMADNLRATAIKGDAGAAECWITVAPNRNVFIATEAARGVTYLGIGPAHAAAAAQAVNEAAGEMMAGRKVEAEQGEPKAAEEAGTAARKSADRSEAARRGWRTRRERQEGS
ncbi:hypothetical protein OV203_02520 [Nannocystis sp. ILAH1]|uniref:hypothetical protein n=1 Tax=Nannocystis sp. ILAH1 TaxID=2996789 RepID=UPI002271CCE0|nr:hypothetical protein [Nannocystis sp. ILAH1]MCY0985986.1 hypothetical protein [Nannocystis sp. ILAH1]